MRRNVLIVLAAGVLLSGCKYWVGWPLNGIRFTDGPYSGPRNTGETVYSPHSDADTKAEADDKDDAR